MSEYALAAQYAAPPLQTLARHRDVAMQSLVEGGAMFHDLLIPENYFGYADTMLDGALFRARERICDEMEWQFLGEPVTMGGKTVFVNGTPLYHRPREDDGA